MKKNVLLVFACFCAALLGSNVEPVLTGAGKILFPESSTPANISASSGALSVNSGGSNQPVKLNPSGSGLVVANSAVSVPNNTGYASFDSAASQRYLIWLGNENPDILHVRNGQRGVGGLINLESMSGGAAGMTVDASGNVNATTGFEAGGTVGQSGTLGLNATVTGGIITNLGSTGTGITGSENIPGGGSITFTSGLVTAAANPVAGIGSVLNVRNAANTGSCSITVTGGIITASTC